MSFDLNTGCLLFIIVLLVLWLLTRRSPGLPPGPPLLPIVGNLLSMDADPRVMFAKLRRKYGDIFCVYMFHKPVIVLNGYNVIRDALVKHGDAFADRPHTWSSKYYVNGGENLIQIISDLFHAGTETTSTTILWTLLYFLNYPHVQEKCFQEIKENIGLNRSPSMKDKTRLPHLEATIIEVLRHADVVPTSLPHAVSQDVQFQGYTLPKGIMVIPMLDSVLQDKDIWGDPENFRPERFLDDAGKYKKMEEFIAFGLGRRVSLGESLARMELFLFLTSVIQRFKFVTPEGVKPSVEGIMGVTYMPKPFKVRAIRRD